MTPELTFSSQRGSAVLDRDWKPVKTIAVGDEVIVPSLFGYCNAKIADVAPPYAETEGLVFHLFKHGDEWWCESSTTKEVLKHLVSAL